MSVFDALLADHDTSAHGDGVLMAPDDIAFENPLFDVAFHPTRQVIAVADIDGYVFWCDPAKKKEKSHVTTESTDAALGCAAISTSSTRTIFSSAR